MSNLSIYELSKKEEKRILEEEIDKRKNSQMTIFFEEYWFSYDFSLMELQAKINQNVIEISDLYSKLNDFEKKYLLRDLAINEICLSSLDRRYQLSNRSVFSSWVHDNEKSYSSLIDTYKGLLNGEVKKSKDINDLKHIYDMLIRPLNNAYHLKNVKRYHYFRTEPLTLNNESNLFLKEEGESDEQSIIAKMNEYLNFLNESPFDPFIKSGIFFFLFMKCMPFYNENFFICKFAISSYLQKEMRNDLLAVSLGNFLNNYRDLLISSFYETKAKENHGDLSHFVKMFLKIILDGTNRLLQKLAIDAENKKELFVTLSRSESKSFLKLKSILVSSSIYSQYGSSILELKEISGVSVPTINRFLEKYRKNLNKMRFIKRDYYRFG